MNNDRVIIANRFELLERIGSGSFGSVYCARDLSTREKVAVKLEQLPTSYPQVIREAKIMKMMGNSSRSIGIPRMKWYGSHGNNYNALAMELLGVDLEYLFIKCGRKFSLKTTLMIADQLIRRVQYFHEKHFVHRDIKPQNFMIGVGPRKSRIIHVIDYGLSKKYRDPRGIHMSYRDDKRMTGTARYASINNHLGIEQSRRDDLESLGYLFIYFLKGRLPWSGLRAKSKREKFRMIQEKKIQISLPSLIGESIPQEFGTYIGYVRSLGFEDQPDYQYLRQLFRDLFKRKEYKLDCIFDWDEKNNINNIRNNNNNFKKKIKKRRGSNEIDEILELRKKESFNNIKKVIHDEEEEQEEEIVGEEEKKVFQSKKKKKKKKVRFSWKKLMGRGRRKKKRWED